MRFFSLAALAVSLSACTATIPPVEVTRFHLGQSIAPAAIAIAPLAGEDGSTIEFRTYAIAVGRELNRLGFAEGQNAPLIAEVGFDRATRERLPQRSPVSIGIGGGSFGRGGGIGIGTSFGIGGSRSRDVVVTRLDVRLKRKGDGQTIWEGRAETEAPGNAPAAQPGLAAEKLARALFATFPGESGKTILVP
jgi:Domain of unknown function (DUF4136)